jgi:hypothetical protein
MLLLGKSMNRKEIIPLLLCLLLLPTNNPAYSTEKNQEHFPSWFNIDANIFNIKYVLPLNMSSNTRIIMDVVIPEDSIFQEIMAVFSEPSPNSSFTDENGLRKFRYELSTTLPRFLNITIHYTVLVLFSSLPSNFYETLVQENIPNEIREKYTKPSPYIESDDDNVIGNATIICGNATDDYSKVIRLFNFVSNRTLFVYDENVQKIPCNSYSHVRGALWALENHKGVCFDFAHLFVALLRAVDIPSRVAEGIILDGRSGFIVHDWAEVYFSGVGWIPFDPTWNEMESNIHMKILNPVYDQYVRWNYSIQSGWLYRFPENATYAINDEIYIENITYPSIIDSIAIKNDSYINFTRIFEFNNKTINSSIYIHPGSQTIDNFYGRLQVNFSKTNFAKFIDYYSIFKKYRPKEMQIQLSAPLNLIFSDSIIPSLGDLTYSYTFGAIRFTMISPVIWIGAILILLGSTILLAKLFKSIFKIRRRDVLPPFIASSINFLALYYL